MRIACYGFSDHTAGSVVGANHVILKELLARGAEVDFFNKPSFVPAVALRGEKGFSFVDCNNAWGEAFDEAARRVVGKTLATPAQRVNHHTFARRVIQAMRLEHQRSAFDSVLFLGTSAFGVVAHDLPTVSWLQGPPGTDARSIVRRFEEVRRCSGTVRAGLLWAYGRMRSGKNRFRGYGHSDRLIVGSRWSKVLLCSLANLEARKVGVLPYPVSLESFRIPESSVAKGDAIGVLWLGRIVPRKRLDLFLDGAALAIDRGLDVRLTIVGDIGFAPGYERLIEEFAHPDRLVWRRSVPRAEASRMLQEADVLAQPSEEENFGASVAEALACGTPVIVGPTNGTGEYACSQSITLAEYTPEAFAGALIEMNRRRSQLDARVCRTAAEHHFAVGKVVDGLVAHLEGAILEKNANE